MIESEYLIALYGWVFFNFVALGFAKDKDDDQNKAFNFCIWWAHYWDNALVSFMAIPVVVMFNVDLWELIVNVWMENDIHYNKLSLMGSVPLVQLIYFLIRKISK